MFEVPPARESGVWQKMQLIERLQNLQQLVADTRGGDGAAKGAGRGSEGSRGGLASGKWQANSRAKCRVRLEQQIKLRVAERQSDKGRRPIQ